MSTLLALQTAILAALKADVSELRLVRPHEGRFTEASLARLMTLPQSAHLAVLALGKGRPLAGGQVDHDVSFALYIVTKETAAATYGASAVHLVETIVRWVYQKTFGVACAFPAEAPSARSLASDGLASHATTLWEVAWLQTVRFDGRPDGDPAGQVPGEVWLGRAPLIGADHEDDYDLVGRDAA